MQSLEPQLMPQIQEYKRPSGRRKFWLKTRRFLENTIMAAALGAGTGYLAGTATQEKARGYYDIDNVKNELVVTKIELGKRAVNAEAEKRRLENLNRKSKVLDFLSKIVKHAKEIAKDPVGYVKDSDAALELIKKYNSAIELVDAAAFAVPLALLTVMVGCTSLLLLYKLREDPLKKEEAMKLEYTLNEIINRTNQHTEILYALISSDQINSSQAVETAQAIARNRYAMQEIVNAIADLASR